MIGTKTVSKSVSEIAAAIMVFTLLTLTIFAFLFASIAEAAVPTDITLSPMGVKTGTDTSSGYVVGSLSTTDVDVADTFTYSIVGGPDDTGVLVIVNTNDLQLTDGTIDINNPTDFDNDGVYEVTIRTNDGSNDFDKSILVKIYNPLIHSSLSTDSSKWVANGWGVTGGQYGQFTCATCHARGTGNIKRVRTDIGAQVPGIPGAGETVSFLDASEGSSDFGDDSTLHPTSTKVCEVCHTYDAGKTVGVEFHGYAMASDPDHYNNADCTTCHQHKEGFKPQACDSCHGYPPTVGTATGGPTGLANEPFTTASTNAGSHQTHALDLGYACTNCHDSYSMPEESSVKTGFGDISIGFNNFGSTTGSYSGQSSVSYNNVLGSGGANCTNIYCHSTAQSSDGDSATPSSYSSPSWGGGAVCGTCHANQPPTGSHAAHIADGAVCNVCHNGAVEATTVSTNHVDGNIDVDAGTYTAAGTPGNGYGTCSTATCHDDGRTANLTDTWGAVVADCAECHAVQPATGGHDAHIGVNFAGSAITCGDCHTNAVESSSGGDNHRDGDVNATGSYPVQAKGGTYQTCTTAACHQTGQSTDDFTETSAWDADDANCTQCHLASPSDSSHASHIVTVGADCSACHTNATKDTSYDDAAHGDLNIDVAVGGYTADRELGGAKESCTLTCHSDGMAASGTSPVWGTVGGSCDICHLSDMDTGSHDEHLAAGAVCGDCHDGAVKDSDGGTAHADDNVDVTATYATADAAYGSGTWTTCSAASCHDDGRAPNETAVWGATINDCAECHATVPATGSHAAHLAVTGIDCGDCHTGAAEGTTAPTANHRNDRINVNAGGYPADRAYTQTYTNCATASCHNNGQGTDGTSGSSLVPTPNWGVSQACGECHAESPTSAKHDEHIDVYGSTCGDCHLNAGDGSGLPTSNHLNGTIDVLASLNYDMGSSGMIPGDGWGNCSNPNTGCHGTPDVRPWDNSASSCNSCHGASGATGAPLIAGDMISTNSLGQHNKHVVDEGYSCNICHNGHGMPTTDDKIKISFTGMGAGGSYDPPALWTTSPDKWLYDQSTSTGTQDCSNIYCHSTVQSTDGTSATPYAYATADWGNASTGDCGTCHANQPPTGSHAVHIADGAACNVCHNGAVEGTTVSTNHVNGNIEVDSGTYTAAGAPGNNFGTCSTATCHDDGRTANLTDTWGTTINNCAECHATAPTTGSHTTHLGTYACATCHTGTTQGTTAGAGHRDGNITTAASTGLGAKVKGTDYTSCGTNNCHGSGSPIWGTDLSANDECTQCHGQLVASASDAQKAPGGSGVDTNGDSAATDAQVGAHQIHLNPTMSAVVACSTCHAIPGTITAAGHIDSALPAELTFSGLALGGLDGQAAVSPANSQAGCATTYCHDGAALKRGGAWDNGTLAPTWTNTGFIAGTVADCDNCHGYPPASGHPQPATNCNACHGNTVAGTNDGFTDPSLHVNGTVEASVDNCSDCHSSLSNDHSDHVDYNYFLAGKTVSAGDYGKAAGSGTNGFGWYDVEYVSGQPLIGCGQCHPAAEGVNHPINGLNIDVDGSDELAALTPLAPNPKLNNSSPNYSFNECSGVYCHSDGAGTFDATPPAWGTDTIDDCKGCHGNSPTTNAHNLHEVGIHYKSLLDDDRVGLMAQGTDDIGAADGEGGNYGAGAAHGDSAQSTTLTCYTCHKDTVEDGTNAGNTTCSNCHIDSDSISTGNELARIGINSWTHINGQADVSFADLSTFKSKAQLRNDITVTAEVDASWARYKSASPDNTAYKLADSYDMAKNAVPTYNSGDKSCSTVDCHNGIDTPTWDSASDNCLSCHTQLPQ